MRNVIQNQSFGRMSASCSNKFEKWQLRFGAALVPCVMAAKADNMKVTNFDIYIILSKQRSVAGGIKFVSTVSMVTCLGQGLKTEMVTLSDYKICEF